MASTFTTSFGIEKIGTGEQAGAWGTTTNHNADILDRIASYKSVGLSGTTHTLTVREASPGAGTENLQDGMYRVIKFTGALGANNTVTIAPNTSSAWFIFENATTDSGSSGPYSVILSQGSGANITLQNGKNAIVYCDGAGSGAAVFNALNDLQMATLEVTGAGAVDGALTVGGTTTAVAITASGLVTAGAKIDMNGTELILDADADTSITADTDDQIDIRIAGADDFQFTANTFTAQSGSTIAAQALTATTVTASSIVTANAKVDLNGTELILDADADTSITAYTDDQIDVRIAGADDFQFTANDFTALSGSVISTNTIAETTADTGVTIDGLLIKDGGLTDLSLPAVSGIIEANANFVDVCLVGPSVDGQSWNGKFSNGAVWTSLMLASVETSGSDAQVNLWDLTAATLTGATPLATLTLTGATPTSIAASMGYLIVGTSDQGFHIVDPHTGAWAERTEGALKTLSTSTAPALADNNVFDVAIQMPDNGSAQDPNTGGLVPFISWTYGASADECGILNNGAVYNKTEGTATDNVTAIDSYGFVYTTNNTSDYGRKSNFAINQILADDWGTSIFFDGSGGAGPTFTGAQGDANSISLGPDGKIVTATDAGLNYGYTHGTAASSDLAGYVNRTFTTGYLGQSCVLAGLANSDTADRSGNAHNLTEEGTVAEVTIASGAELKGYQFATANYLKTPVADAAFEMGTGGFTVSVWVYSESDPSTAGIVYYRNATSGAVPQWGLVHNSSQQIQATVNDGTDSITITSSVSIIDSKPHLLSMTFNGTTKELSLFVDGAFQGSGIDTDVGTLSGGSGFAVGIGNVPEGGSFAWDGTNSWMALLRINQSSVLGTEDDFLRMYRDELPLYSANAKCLLQSGSTDIVLDAAVDPLTGKVIVTQTDSQDIFDGLVIETERTVATGGSTFEHGLLFGDAVAEINNANLFASTPATDQRQVNEMVRSMSADVPAGVDVSKAKVLCHFSGSSMYADFNYNVESLVDNGTGNYTINFSVPFKNNDYVALASSGSNEQSILTPKDGSVVVFTGNSSGSGSDPTDVMLAVFGELDNE